MGWPATKCMRQAGIPAATMFVGNSIINIVRSDVPISDIVFTNLGLYVLIWLGVSVLLWGSTRMTG